MKTSSSSSSKSVPPAFPPARSCIVAYRAQRLLAFFTTGLRQLAALRAASRTSRAFCGTWADTWSSRTTSTSTRRVHRPLSLRLPSNSVAGRPPESKTESWDACRDRSWTTSTRSGASASGCATCGRRAASSRTPTRTTSTGRPCGLRIRLFLDCIVIQCAAPWTCPPLCSVQAPSGGPEEVPRRPHRPGAPQDLAQEARRLLRVAGQQVRPHSSSVQLYIAPLALSYVPGSHHPAVLTTVCLSVCLSTCLPACRAALAVASWTPSLCPIIRR